MNYLNMPWNRWYSLKSYVGASLWIVPVVALLIQVVVKRASEALGAWMYRSGFYDLKTAFFGLSMSGARATLDTVITANMSFLVFTFGSLLVAIQVASGQYTPRIIATTLLRDNPIRYSVGIFLFTLLFANRTLSYMGETEVHQFQVALSLMFGAVSFIAFLFLIDYAAKFLRPVSLVGLIGEHGIEVIESVYPNPTRGVDSLPAPRKRRARSPLAWVMKGEPGRMEARSGKRGAPDRTFTHLGRSKVLLAVNLPALVAEARRAGVVIEARAAGGRFRAHRRAPVLRLRRRRQDRRANCCGSRSRSAPNAPWSRIRCSRSASSSTSPPRRCRRRSTIRPPRCSRSTSCTACCAWSGCATCAPRRSPMTRGRCASSCERRTGRISYNIAFREIRLFGAGNLQIPRRLSAMIENLVQTLPEHRHAALRTELELLDRAIAEHYQYPEDLALARMPDPQGMGGSSRSRE